MRANSNENVLLYGVSLNVFFVPVDIILFITLSLLRRLLSRSVHNYTDFALNVVDKV